jgi:MFS family permease
MGQTETDAVEGIENIETTEARAHVTQLPRPGMFGRYSRLPRNVFAIGIVSFLNDASSEIIYPLLPLFLSLTLGASPAVIGIIEGIAESISSLLKLFAGYFSDRRGKRKAFVVFGYGLASFARPLLGLATNWYQVLAVRVSDRIGKGIRSAPRDAMIADAAPIQDRGLAFGFHRAMDHLGAVLGPLIAYAIVHVIALNAKGLTAGDYRTIFACASVPALAAMVVVIFFVREKKDGVLDDRAEAKKVAPPKLSLAGFDSNFKRFLVLVALFTLSNSSDAFLLLRANQAGILGDTTLLLWAALHISKVVSSIVGGGMSDRLGRRSLIVSGWMLYALVYLAFAFISAPWMAWTLFVIYGVYFGLAEGSEKALVADLVRPEQRGTAFGLYNFAFGITVFPASLLMGLLWNFYGARTAFIFSAVLGAGAAVLLLLLVQNRASGSGPAEALNAVS